MEIDVHSPPKWNSDYLPILRELRDKKDAGELETKERRVFQWLVSAHTNFLLEIK